MTTIVIVHTVLGDLVPIEFTESRIVSGEVVAALNSHKEWTMNWMQIDGCKKMGQISPVLLAQFVFNLKSNLQYNFFCGVNILVLDLLFWSVLISFDLKC